MTLGYDEPRPSEEDYHKTLSRLKENLGPFAESGLSLMLFGSYVRGEAIYGESDIDTVLIFPHDTVTDKGYIKEVGRAFAQSIPRSFPLQVSPLDIGTARDGRFSSFGEDFGKYFLEEAQIAVGPDYRGEITYEPSKSGPLTTTAHNLRVARQGLILRQHYLETNRKKMIEKFHKTLKGTTSSLKQVLYLCDGELRRNRFATIEALAEQFPEVDLNPLLTLKKHLQNPEELEGLYQDDTDVELVWNSSLTLFERVIKAYINKFSVSKSI